MKHGITAALILLLLCAALTACADGWPAEGDISASVWISRDNAFAEDAGDTVPEAADPQGGYYAPRVFVTNSTDQPRTFTMTWLVDDADTLNFGTLTAGAGETVSATMAEATAALYRTKGEHRLTVSIDGAQVFTWSWQALCDEPRPQATARPTELNFVYQEMTPDSLSVSGLNWRYKSKPAAAAKTLKNLSAAQVEEGLKNGASYALNYKLNSKKLEQPRTFDADIVIVSPDGFEYTVSGSISLRSGTASLSYDFLGDGFFKACYAQTGHILSGTYTLRLYLNDMLANVSTVKLD